MGKNRLRNIVGMMTALAWTAAVFGPPAFAEVRLPKVFSSHMVLQRQKPIIVWGWAEPNETVTIKIGDTSQQTQANDRGEWKATLPAMEAGGPYTLTVSGSSAVTCEDVLVGEVWLCSGQSNMEMGIGRVQNAQEEIATADHPQIRLLKVERKWSATPLTDIEGSWKVCSPSSVAAGGWNGFSAAAYFFGRELQQKLSVPIGLIDATWGGTRIDSWTPPEGFAMVPALKQEYESVQLADPRSSMHEQKLRQTLDDTERWLAEARKGMVDHAIVAPMPTYPNELLPPHDLQDPTALYNGSIHPLHPFALRGAIWYQGESNYGDGGLYAEKMKALVGGWRKVWDEGEFPFYFVQIAPCNYNGDPERMGVFWEAQARAAREIPNAGMAVINDIGDLKDIHPKDKQDVGHRLALLALANTYGQKDVICSGPTFKSLEAEGDKLRVAFDNVGAGLSSRDGKPLTWFEVIDADEGGFVKADAQIDGANVVLSAPESKHPVAMRFAWSMFAEPNLMNSAGLPASAFRAGNVPNRDLLLLKVPEAKDYKLVYDLDLTKLDPTVSYEVDGRAQIQQPFDRIAYFIELQKADGNTEYLFASMDAFTGDLGKIGVPTAASGAHFQKNVANLDVFSNVKGIVTGTGLAGGNIEFWPNNYGPGNGAKVPNASSEVYDFGDEPSDPVDGYGSMQVHNHDAKQTLFALNHWRDGRGADIGIGNQSTNNPDWTFARNAGAYAAGRLRVLVRLK